MIEIIKPMLVGLLVSSVFIGIVYCMGEALEHSNYSARFYDIKKEKNLFVKIGYLLWIIAIIGIIAAICYIIGSAILIPFNK